ncbi:MAG: hypothetical protein HY869_21135 [Chloroflexi bacterium]|nr:hypothetical protein [Chloroflexota bacterium]
MSHNKKNVDSWFEYARSVWLTKTGSRLQFRSSVEQLINKLQKLSADHKRFGEAWHYVEEIEQLQSRIRRDDRLYPREFPNMLLECGVAAYKMGNSREAVRLLSGSIGYCTDDHDKAVARWMLGCVYWNLENEVEAISSWENSMQEFSEQRKKIDKMSSDAIWYSNQIAVMERAIQGAVNNRIPPMAPGASDIKNKAACKNGNHTISFLSVLGEIPAGTPRNVVPAAAEFLFTDRIMLEDREYCVSSLVSGNRVINFSYGHHYFALRVRGNSMNRSTPFPIEDGNYVILRAQDTADPNDIVAAEIIGIDERATLKRLRRESKGYFLVPESNDPEFQNPIYLNQNFRGFNDDFYIRGVAVAVLKPS